MIVLIVYAIGQIMPNHRGLMLNILLLASLWGFSFLFIKIAVVEIPPITLVTLRIGLSALLLVSVLKFKKIPFPREAKLWKQCFFMGIVASSAPFILFSLSLEHIDSILCSLINGTTPITTIILANYFLKDEKFTIHRLVGILLGFSGFLVLFLPSLLKGGIKSDSFGMICSLGASFCYAIGMVYARKNIIAPKEPLILPTLQLTTSLIYLIPLSFLFYSSFSSYFNFFKLMGIHKHFGLFRYRLCLCHLLQNCDEIWCNSFIHCNLHSSCI